MGIRPNAVSLASVLFSALAGGTLVGGARAGLPWAPFIFVVAATAMEVRLLCNLFDGMLAVEHGMQSKTGFIYNDLPDRVSDLLIMVGAGYAVVDWTWGPALGWAAGTTALGTAYVRLLGGSAGLPQDFGGPMAKQLRMHVMAAGSVLAAVLSATNDGPNWALTVALAIVAAGSILTIGRRTRNIARQLEKQ
jgi:phosphatidylglycerophosphate synthase